MRYTVVYDQTRRNYSAFVPMLPVVVMTAPTLAALERDSVSAIRFHLGDIAPEVVDVDLVPHHEYTGPMLTADGELVPHEPLAYVQRRTRVAAYARPKVVV